MVTDQNACTGGSPAFSKMQDVPAGERMAVGVGHQDRIDGAFWRVRA
jgi:hypothetical protein